MKAFKITLAFLVLNTLYSPVLAEVDKSMVGTWKMTLQGNLDLVWRVEPDGSYESYFENVPTAPRETGKVVTRDSHFSVQRFTGARAGKSTNGKFSFPSPDRLFLDATDGASEWTRASGASLATSPAQSTSLAAAPADATKELQSVQNAGSASSTPTGAGGAVPRGTDKLSPLLNKVAGLAATNPAAQRLIGSSINRYVPGQLAGGLNSLVNQGMATAGGGGGGAFGTSGGSGLLGGGSAALLSSGVASNPDLGYAQRFEQQGDYFNAALKYQNALRSAGGDLTPADMAAANRNHTSGMEEMKKRMARDPGVLEISKRMAHCNCMLIRERFAGKPGSTDINYSINSLFQSYQYLQNADRENAAWYYLSAVYWCVKTDTMEYNYKQALLDLNKALKCKQITASTKQKAEALRHHIFPAVVLQLKDLDRAKFQRMMNVVDNVEHPTITNFVDNSGAIVNTYDSRNSIDSYYYGVYKEILRTEYPQFAHDFNGFLKYCRSLPNKGIPVPPGPGNDEVAEYGIPQWEQKAFGPLNFSTGRL